MLTESLGEGKKDIRNAVSILQKMKTIASLDGGRWRMLHPLPFIYVHGMSIVRPELIRGMVRGNESLFGMTSIFGGTMRYVTSNIHTEHNRILLNGCAVSIFLNLLSMKNLNNIKRIFMGRYNFNINLFMDRVKDSEDFISAKHTRCVGVNSTDVKTFINVYSSYLTARNLATAYLLYEELTNVDPLAQYDFIMEELRHFYPRLPNKDMIDVVL